MKFKIIKSKAFEAKGQKATHYTVAYKGRLFGVNTLRFEESDITVEGDVITFNTDIEVLKRVDTDQLTGEVKSYHDLVPKCNLTLAAF